MNTKEINNKLRKTFRTDLSITGNKFKALTLACSADPARISIQAIYMEVHESSALVHETVYVIGGSIEDFNEIWEKITDYAPTQVVPNHETIYNLSREVKQLALQGLSLQYIKDFLNNIK